RPGEQFRLAVPNEIAHRSVGAEDTCGCGVDFDLAYAAHIKHGPENGFALMPPILCRLSPGGALLKSRHQRVDFSHRGRAQHHLAAPPKGDSSPSRVADRASDNPPQP